MNINDLIAKYVLDKSSQEDLDTLREWESSSKENIDALNQIRNSWDDLDRLKYYEDFSPELAWSKIDPELNEEELARTFRLPWSSIAAAVLLICSAVIFWPKSVDPIKTDFSSTDTIEHISEMDGSEIILAAFSKVDLPKDYSTVRAHNLDGKAFFKVAHDGERPYTIKTIHGDITVLGTEFSVDVSDDRFEVFVVEGKVAVRFNSRDVHLTAGEACKLFEGALVKYRLTTPNYLSWVDQKIVFEDADLETFVETLQRHYNVTITVSENINTNQCKINTVYTDETLQEVLDELKTVFGLNYSIENGQYRILDIQC